MHTFFLTNYNIIQYIHFFYFYKECIHNLSVHLMIDVFFSVLAQVKSAQPVRPLEKIQNDHLINHSSL